MVGGQQGSKWVSDEGSISTATLTETGLRCPDGTEIWPPETWHSHPLATEAERDVVAQAIIDAAATVHMPVEDLISRYTWVTRSRVIRTVTLIETTGETGWALLAPEMIGDPNAAPLDGEVILDAEPDPDLQSG